MRLEVVFSAVSCRPALAKPRNVIIEYVWFQRNCQMALTVQQLFDEWHLARKTDNHNIAVVCAMPDP